MNRAQEWSNRAFRSVRGRKKDLNAASYRTACMKMPGLVHQSGLLQALVFVVARDEAGKDYVDDLAKVLFRDDTQDHHGLIERSQKAALPDYLALCRDVLAVAQWLRRFAQVELAEESRAD